MGDAFRSPRRFSRIAFAVALSAGAGAPAAPGAVHRLSAGQSFSTIELGSSKPALTPDGKRVVYCQNAETVGAFSLWSVRLAGGAPVRLSGALAGGGQACWFRISPDGTRVVYLANQDSPSTYELFSAPVDGSALAVKLNPSLIANGNVTSLFEISPNSATVVYRADQVIDDRFDLWSVPIGGGAAVKINVLVNPASDVSAFAISPSGLQVAYISDENDDERPILIGRPIGGGALEFIGEVAPAAGAVFDFKFTPDGTVVVLRADLLVEDRIELCRVETDGVPAGSSPVGPTPVANGDAMSFAISPNSSWVVYLADLDLDNLLELFVCSPGNTNCGQLSAPLPASGDVDAGYAISPNSARAVYVADQVVDGRYELYSVPLPSGAVTPLNPILPGGSNVAFDLLIPPDSSRVVYRVIHAFGLGTTELDSVPIVGGPSVLLSPAPPTGISTAQRQVLAAGGAHLFYELQAFPELPATNTTIVYRAAIAGGELLPISPVLDLAAGETFFWLGAAAHARQALFVSNDDTGAQSELYAGDICLLCDGFDSAGTTRWSTVLP